MLSDVTILITTFMRPGYLKECLRGIHENLPECETSVACDDKLAHHVDCDSWTLLPFDSGLTAKRNAAVRKVWTKYALLGCDDFDFSTVDARKTVLDMVEVLDQNKNMDVVVGRVDHKEYEGYFEYVPGEYIKEHRSKVHDRLVQIDIGVNFFLARTEVLREVPWDETIRPIGGEHADWFLSMKEAEKEIIFLSTANVNTFHNSAWMHPDYMKYRRRAHLGHELFLKKRGVKRYYGFDEDIR